MHFVKIRKSPENIVGTKYINLARDLFYYQFKFRKSLKFCLRGLKIGESIWINWMTGNVNYYALMTVFLVAETKRERDRKRQKERWVFKGYTCRCIGVSATQAWAARPVIDLAKQRVTPRSASTPSPLVQPRDLSFYLPRPQRWSSTSSPSSGASATLPQTSPPTTLRLFQASGKYHTRTKMSANAASMRNDTLWWFHLSSCSFFSPSPSQNKFSFRTSSYITFPSILFLTQR